MLKLLEGVDVDGVSTEKMLFLFSGAFSELTSDKKPTATPIGFDRVEETEAAETELSPKDFIRYGMEPELIGRIQRCVRIEQLGYEDLRRILHESSLSVFRKYRKFFGERGHALELDMDLERRILENALERGLGARGLNAIVEEWIEPKLIELAEGTR